MNLFNLDRFEVVGLICIMVALWMAWNGEIW